MTQVSRVEALGVAVDAVTTDDVVALLVAAIRDRRRLNVAHHNLHSAYLVHREPSMQRWYEMADVIHIDGMSLVVAGRLTGAPLARRHRSTYVDLVVPVLAQADARGWRVFALGGAPGVAETFASSVRAQHDRVTIAAAPGYFDHSPGSTENAAVVGSINDFRPDVLLVGMGMPTQEVWLADNHASLDATVLMPVGGLFDYVAGEAHTPPRWLGGLGLEWLYRLARDPRRLAFRYLIEPLLLAAHLARHRR